MNHVQRHRGPDGDGIWIRDVKKGPPYVALGHRRLAIIDLSDAGKQPMSNEDGCLWITYNGEIYNYLELRATLAAAGHTFRSNTDTEVIIHAYEQWGDRCVEQFNGMFAFAIWDEKSQCLFCARDRFGEKPFHYFFDQRKGTVVFASEIKALLSSHVVPAEVDEATLRAYALGRWPEGTSRTIWSDISRLPNAHSMTVQIARMMPRLRRHRYWDVPLSASFDLSLEQAGERFGKLFRESVNLRLRSDVPVGTSLSGGLDSSAVVGQISELGATSGQKTFSARMDEAALDEGCYIQQVVQKTAVENYQVWPRAADFRESFERFCYHLEEPVHMTSQFAQYLVMRLARDHNVTVILDGQGADEILGGYRKYFSVAYISLAARHQFLGLLRERLEHNRVRSGSFPVNVRMAFNAAFPGFARFLRSKREDSSRLRSDNILWNSDWLGNGDVLRIWRPPHGTRDGLSAELYRDTFHGHLQTLLRYGDRNSMAFSRELRQPFLDHRLAELAFSLPDGFKVASGRTKVLLRRAVSGLIPDGVLARTDKLGYQAPMKMWFRGELGDWTKDKLSDSYKVFGDRMTPGLVDDLDALTTTEQKCSDLLRLLSAAECLRVLSCVKSQLPK